MNGMDNVGFDDREKRVNIDGDAEITQNNDTMVKLDNSKPEPSSLNKKDLDKDNNAITRILLKIRSFLYDLFFNDSPGSDLFRKFLLNGCAVAFLAVSVYQFIKRDDISNVDWCDGAGFLWIMYILFYYGFLHSTIKQHFGKSIHNAFKPITKLGHTLGANRYFRWICYASPVVALTIYVIVSPGKSGRRIFSFLGIVVFTIFGFIFSKYPGHIKWRPVIFGLVLQFTFGLLTVQWAVGKNILACLGNKITRFLQYTEEGAGFVYGYLGVPQNNTSPVFAFSVLSVVYFLCFFVNILSYYGILQWFILKISWVVKLIMGTTVCESVNAAASIFLGMTESPLLVKSHLKDLTKSEICAIMCAGWSTVAGTVMAAYIKFGVNASHLIAASIMSAPASLSYSKLFYPETEESKNTVEIIQLEKEPASNALDAASKGALSAVLIVAGIIANIIAFLAFLSFLDGMLIWVGFLIGIEELSFKYIMSKIFVPISFLMGVDENSLEEVAYLVGIKTVANEFQAYQMLGQLIKEQKLSERSEIIATYALCGFSNFGSIGITVGALSTIEPSQRSNITEVALRAFVAANIVCFLTACVAGCLVD